MLEGDDVAALVGRGELRGDGILPEALQLINDLSAKKTDATKPKQQK